MASLPAPVKAHPNALVALGGAAGIGTAVTTLVEAFGGSIDPKVASTIGGAVAFLALLVARPVKAAFVKGGLRGIIRFVWRGSG